MTADKAMELDQLQHEALMAHIDQCTDPECCGDPPDTLNLD